MPHHFDLLCLYPTYTGLETFLRNSELFCALMKIPTFKLILIFSVIKYKKRWRILKVSTSVFLPCVTSRIFRRIRINPSRLLTFNENNLYVLEQSKVLLAVSKTTEIVLLACLSPDFPSLLLFDSLWDTSSGIAVAEEGAMRSLSASLMTFVSSAWGQEKSPLWPTVSILIATERKRTRGKVTAHPRTADGSVAIGFQSTTKCYTRQTICTNLQSALFSDVSEQCGRRCGIVQLAWLRPTGSRSNKNKETERFRNNHWYCVLNTVYLLPNSSFWKANSSAASENLHSFYGTRKLFTGFARAGHLSVSWQMNLVHAIPSYLLNCFSILPSQLRLDLPREVIRISNRNFVSISLSYRAWPMPTLTQTTCLLRHKN